MLGIGDSALLCSCLGCIVLGLGLRLHCARPKLHCVRSRLQCARPMGLGFVAHCLSSIVLGFGIRLHGTRLRLYCARPKAYVLLHKA